VKCLPLECPFCQRSRFDSVHVYTSRPEGETCFGWDDSYRRELFQCEGCRHYFSVMPVDLEAIYAAGYVDATYDESGLKAAFQRLVSLPADRSDNQGRVRAVDEFARIWLGGVKRRLLDVGSGLCIFPFGMKAVGWDCTAVDPDLRAVQHAREVCGVESICANFMQWDARGQAYDLVTFNKVLEHVADPIAMLAHSRSFLSETGFVYVEVPDGLAAIQDGPGREEFFIEHHHVFSQRSAELLADHAGFRVLKAQRLREPSGKYTLRVFMAAQ